MIKIVIATDSFKESLENQKVADIIAKGFLNIFPSSEILSVGVADGGEGTVKSLVNSRKGKIVALKVEDALKREINSFYGIIDENVAVIELAAASGLELIEPQHRNPMITSTYGVGQLMLDALDRGCESFIIGLGGSATNDAGMGMLQCLGAVFIDENGENLEGCGENLEKIQKIDLSNLDKRIINSKIRVAVDVTNPMYGNEGAAHIFATQKGATPLMIKKLDMGLQNFVKLIEEDFTINLQEISGAGAAGGVGGALFGVLGASLEPGIKIITDYLNLEKEIMKADLVIVGEGKMDSQSIKGKAPIGVASIAKDHNVPVIAICGSLEYDAVEVYQYGIDSVHSIIIKPCNLKQAVENAENNLLMMSESIAKTVKVGLKLNDRKREKDEEIIK